MTRTDDLPSDAQMTPEQIAAVEAAFRLERVADDAEEGRTASQPTDDEPVRVVRTR